MVRPKLSIQVFAITILAMLILSGTLVVNSSLLNFLTREDGPIEYLGFAFLLMTGVILLRGGIVLNGHSPSQRLKRATLVLAGLAFVVAAGEEISWGQRLIGFETPEALLEVNDQDEFNLHNIEKGLVDHSIRYGIALFAAAGLAFYITGTSRFLGFKTPDLFLVHAFLLLGLYQNYQAIDKPFYLSAGFLFLSLIYFLVRGPRMVAWIPGITLLAGCLVIFLHWQFRTRLGINTPPEIRESLFPVICTAYAIAITKDNGSDTAPG